MSKAPARSDLPTRFAAGVLMIAISVLAVYVGGWLFRAFVLAAAAAMLLEWGDMHRVPRLWSWFAAALMAALLLAGAEILFPVGSIDEILGEGGVGVEGIASESFEPAWLGFGAAAAFALLVAVLSRRVAMGWGFFYIAAPAFALLAMSWAWFGLVLWTMLVTWATDIFAYFAGRSIGGPKLAPRISPNKTWAGLIGGVAGAGVVGWAAASWLDLGAPFDRAGAAIGLIAVGGDLYESGVKRRCGVKDSGRILPGHGGVLDRLDGLLAATIATFALLLAGLWTG